MSARKSRPKPGRLQARELADDSAASSLLSPSFAAPSSPAPSPPASADVFEIEDFSMATGWERLIRQVEERMVQWQISHGRAGHGRTQAGGDEKTSERHQMAGDEERRCELQYNSKTYRLTCRLSASSSHLPTKPTKPFSPASLPPLSLYLGLASYLLISPSPPRRVSRNESALLLSTLTLAGSAVACSLPLLAPFGLPQQQQYQGRTAVGEAWQFHVRSGDAVVERVRWLSGLEEWWELHRRKQQDRVAECGLIALPPSSDESHPAPEQLSVAVLHTFHLTSSYSAQSSSYPSSGAEVCTWRDTSLDAHTSHCVLWGPITDPLSALSLTAVWHATNSSFTETGSFSELDAMAAPEWRLSVTWREDGRDNDSAAYVEALKALVELGHRARQTKSLADVMGSGEAAVPSGGTSSTPQKQRAITKSSSFSTPPSQSVAASTSSSPVSASRASPSAFTAIKAVQSSLQAHIESAHLNAMYGEPLSHEHVDGVMKNIMDIHPDETNRKQPPPPSSPDNRSSLPASASAHCDPVRAACPNGSLLSLLVCQLLLLHPKGLLSVRAVAHFWLEFVQELRYHFEAGLVLPHMAAAGEGDEADAGGGVSVGGGGMDYNGCVVWQKMQVLQQCIAVSRQRQQWNADNYGSTAAASIFQQAATTPTDRKQAQDDELADGWQEFDALPATPKAEKKQKRDEQPMDMEAEEEIKQRADVGMQEDKTEEREAAPTLTSQQAAQQSRGASHPLQSHSLLCLARPLLVPHTQPSPLLTTDQLDQQADLFSRLAEDETVEAMRREAQEAGLRSDMSAFKAANPGCVMEDFVRWHSPRDWTADDHSGSSGGRGVLSERMRYSGNRWRKLWSESTSVPAWEQVPLFDPLVTGERVLSELEHVDPTSLFAQLTAVAACNWMSAMARTPPVVSSIGDVRQRLTDTHGWLRALPSPSQPAAAEMWDELSSVELQCARITSLLYCFPACLSLIDRLLASPHYAAVSSSDERDAVLSIFAHTERNIHANKPGQAATVQRMPKADVRQYALHSAARDRPDGVGEWLYARVEEREAEVRTGPAQSSYSMKDVKEGRVGGVGAVGSRRLRRGRGGARRAAARGVVEDGEGGEDGEDGPVFVLATSLLTHWPLT